MQARIHCLSVVELTVLRALGGGGGQDTLKAKSIGSFQAGELGSIHPYSLIGTTGLSISMSVTGLDWKMKEKGRLTSPARACSKVLSQSSQSVTRSGSHADGNRRGGVAGIHRRLPAVRAL